MCCFLHQLNFEWNTETQTDEKFLTIADDAEIDYLFDLNIHYPKELHDLHMHQVPESIHIKNSILNHWQTINRLIDKI